MSKIIVIPVEKERINIKQLWNMIPESSKKYYNNDIRVYRHHKLMQIFRDKQDKGN
jgi:hypothetical protein